MWVLTNMNQGHNPLPETLTIAKEMEMLIGNTHQVAMPVARSKSVPLIIMFAVREMSGSSSYLKSYSKRWEKNFVELKLIV